MAALTVPVLQVPQPSSGLTASSQVHEVNYKEERVQVDADLQVKWGMWMSDVQKNSTYKRVFVLLLSWHPECDDMEVAEEVERLGEVFRDTYHYTVIPVLIDSRKPTPLPQAQANHAVSTFVAENDQDDALLIVYYAGHGSPGKVNGELRMTGRRRGSTCNHITWNLVESNLKVTQADVLLIFDCCYSSDLGRGSVLTSRSFEYLAASKTYFTRSPGKSSFTSALIWALKELAGVKQSSRAPSSTSKMFTTTKLALKICDAPGFPEDQKPSLSSRDEESYNRIVLAPLPQESDSPLRRPPALPDPDDDDDEENPVPQCLSLTFHFKTKQEETDLKKLADHLKKFMTVDNTSLQSVQCSGTWTGIKPSAAHKFREVARKLMARQHQEYSPIESLMSNTPVARDISAASLNVAEHSESTPLLQQTGQMNADGGTTRSTAQGRFMRIFRKIWKKDAGSDYIVSNGTASYEGRQKHKKWIPNFLRKFVKTLARSLFRTESHGSV